MTAAGRVALLGDSIFDNGVYVPGEAPVIAQVQAALPAGWEATLLAVDGASARDVQHQLDQVDQSVTHLFVSAGGNDALNESQVLALRVESVGEAERLIAQSQSRFRRNYEELLDRVLETRRPVTLCTVYDAIPGLGQAERAALSAFNDVILRAAFRMHAPVIDLRLVCDEAADYSSISPIEPSASGGAKIARVIADVAVRHDFSIARTVVYV